MKRIVNLKSHCDCVFVYANSLITKNYLAYITIDLNEINAYGFYMRVLHSI